MIHVEFTIGIKRDELFKDDVAQYTSSNELYIEFTL